MKIQSFFSQKTEVIPDTRYHGITPALQKKDKAYNAVKKVVLPPSSNPKEVKLHFAMLFIFVFYSINRYSQKIGKNRFSEGVRKKMKVWYHGTMVPGTRYHPQNQEGFYGE